MIFVLLAVAAAPTWTLTCGGDIMLNGISPAQNPLGQVAPIFANADIAYGNLEIPLTTSMDRTKRKTAEDLRKKNQYILKADPKHIAGIRQCGFDLLSLGNNHGMDYGYTGLKQMQTLLDREGIAWSGAGKNTAEAERVAVKEVGNLRIGMISYLCFMGTGSLLKNTPATTTTPGVAALFFEGTVDAKDRIILESKVRIARAHCDLLFVAPHWGIEKQSAPSAYQKSLGRAFIDAGADGVLGAHPHVLQGWETYRGKPILYSMGNLVSPRPGETALFRLRYSNTKFQSVEVIPCRISGGVVRPITGSAATIATVRIKKLCNLIRK